MRGNSHVPFSEGAAQQCAAATRTSGEFLMSTFRSSGSCSTGWNSKARGNGCHTGTLQISFDLSIQVPRVTTYQRLACSAPNSASRISAGRLPAARYHSALRRGHEPAQSPICFEPVALNSSGSRQSVETRLRPLTICATGSRGSWQWKRRHHNVPRRGN